MSVRWLVAFIDRPASSFEATAQFWLAVTGSTLSPRRGAYAEFATILPASGHSYLRVQRVAAGRGGSHLDLAVDDMTGTAGHARRLGAEVLRELDDVVVMRSPAGFVFCVVGHDGSAQRPLPVSLDGGARAIVDQLCIDIPPAEYENECTYWARLTGWTLHPGSRPEFSYLDRPDGIPLRILLQRTNDAGDGRAHAHLDLACDDTAATAIAHERLGARREGTHEHWIAMRDPAGVPYCLTRRDPDTGRLPSGTSRPTA
ncbi:VOC family protein [Phytoactinopolyspora limicola]|uniref:VOC family protein n=1 Tax=Phytoactinopolyspora limicola TaxID=2715536 RepID=UPI00140E1CEF|nr:VOC family protein [Phytoactinopolyspora limicola]